MCEKCFLVEIQSFPAQSDFEAFDLLLTKKIANYKTMRMGEFVQTAWFDTGYQVYECLVCGQKWKMTKPEISDRGSFMRLNN